MVLDDLQLIRSTMNRFEMDRESELMERDMPDPEIITTRDFDEAVHIQHSVNTSAAESLRAMLCEIDDQAIYAIVCKAIVAIETTSNLIDEMTDELARMATELSDALDLP